MPQCMGEQDRLAIEIYLRMKELAVAPGGVNYNLKSAKVAAAQWLQSLSRDERQAIGLYIDWQNAIYNGAQLTAAEQTSANALRISARMGEGLGAELQRNLLLFLKWKLNSLDEPE
jgi:hypothetical protein